MLLIVTCYDEKTIRRDIIVLVSSFVFCTSLLVVICGIAVLVVDNRKIQESFTIAFLMWNFKSIFSYMLVGSNQSYFHHSVWAYGLMDIVQREQLATMLHLFFFWAISFMHHFQLRMLNHILIHAHFLVLVMPKYSVLVIFFSFYFLFLFFYHWKPLWC